MDNKRLGIKILSKFYLILAFLSFLPLFVFSTQVVFLGTFINSFVSLLIKSLSILFFYFLYLNIKNLTPTGFFVAFLFHVLFLINALLMIWGKTAILKIEGLTVSDYRFKLATLITGLIVNIIIIIYLFFYRRYFIDNKL